MRLPWWGLSGAGALVGILAIVTGAQATLTTPTVGLPREVQVSVQGATTRTTVHPPTTPVGPGGVVEPSRPVVTQDDGPSDGTVPPTSPAGASTSPAATPPDGEDGPAAVAPAPSGQSPPPPSGGGGSQAPEGDATAAPTTTTPAASTEPTDR